MLIIVQSYGVAEDGAHSDNNCLHRALFEAFESSRFKVNLFENPKPNRWFLRYVLLRKSKPYCGSHPFACPNTGVHRPDKRQKFLEGADWVAFNDMLNDVLDRENVSALVYLRLRERVQGESDKMYIRKENFRRTSYEGKPASPFSKFSVWEPDSPNWEDGRGKEMPRSSYPEGTPGIPEYDPEKERDWFPVEEHWERKYA